jgi:hypothetical protein
MYFTLLTEHAACLTSFAVPEFLKKKKTEGPPKTEILIFFQTTGYYEFYDFG